jgi:hypothetical protein
MAGTAPPAGRAAGQPGTLAFQVDGDMLVAGALTVTGVITANGGMTITGAFNVAAFTASGLITAQAGLALTGALTGAFTRAGQTAQLLINQSQFGLGTSFVGAANAIEQEITQARVTLPIIGATCLVKITASFGVAYGAGNTTFKIRAGTSGSYLSNPLILDGIYFGAAGSTSLLVMTVWASLALGTQTYIVFSYLNDSNNPVTVNGGVSQRSNVITEIYQ